MRDSEIRARSEPLEKPLRDRRVALVRLVVALDLDAFQPSVEEIGNGIATKILARADRVNLADDLARGALDEHSATRIESGLFELVGDLLRAATIGLTGRSLYPATIGTTEARIPKLRTGETTEGSHLSTIFSTFQYVYRYSSICRQQRKIPLYRRD